MTLHGQRFRTCIAPCVNDVVGLRPILVVLGPVRIKIFEIPLWGDNNDDVGDGDDVGDVNGDNDG